VDDESVRMIKCHKLAELLNRPLGGGMAAEVRMEMRPEPTSMATKTYRTGTRR
jgi:hypothetical protein